ncbi:class-II fumarase/aspartase family protein [Fusobacterium necrophorum]|uniref:class-II fumarase/aspartase family protein n=1 Tax=Fusobacterium necrophorum TaxID=859 RepID=UPI00370EFBC5
MEFKSNHITNSKFYGKFYNTEKMNIIFDDEKRMQRWLDVEVALLESQCELDIVPKYIVDKLKEVADIKKLDCNEIKKGIENTGHSLFPLLKEWGKNLTSEYTNYIHYGATTQDIEDTSQMLEIKEAIKIYDKRLLSIKAKLVKIIEESGSFPMIGRSHGQYAVPITLGYKLAIWLNEIERHIERLESWKKRGLYGQFGGATGSHNLLGEKGISVGKRFMERLGLKYSNISWQNSRDSIGEFASILALISGSMDKISGEIYLLGKTDVGEIKEGKTKEAGSSTMPHKKNPVLCERIGAISYHVNAMVQVILNTSSHEHERDPRKLWAEWLAIPSLCIYLDSMLSSMEDILANLCIYPDTMIENINKYKNDIISEYVLSCLSKSLEKQKAKEILNNILKLSKKETKDMVEIINNSPNLRDYFNEEMLSIIRNPYQYNGICEKIREEILFKIKREEKNEN